MKAPKGNPIYLFLSLGALLLLTHCSKKNDDNTPASQIPVVSTFAVTNVTQSTATCGGKITSQGSSPVTDMGVCWSMYQNPDTSDPHTIDSSGTGSFTSNLAGLIGGTLYYVRAYATNSSGTAYGNQDSLTTASGTGGWLMDQNGNGYHTVTIGTQIWMAENLRCWAYNDATAIYWVTKDSDWENAGYGAYCWYNNDEVTYHYNSTYGALYNWYAVNTGKLCPTGWHVPTKDDWTILDTYVGRWDGAQLKETGTTHWREPNSSATNAFGFTALPGGWRYCGNLFYDAKFWRIGDEGKWWTSTMASSSSSDAWYVDLFYDGRFLGMHTNDLRHGYSVRCIKNL